MSGFVAMAVTGGRPLPVEMLTQMTEHLAFRGPDRQEQWHSDMAGLGHALLATTEEAQTERQPVTLDGIVCLTGDCRVDGRADLVSLLRGRGRSVTAHATDPELILHAYHAWGEACVDHLIGDFAFVIWDGARRTLFGARDQTGVKLFYYALTPDGIVCSNTLSCIRLHPGVSHALNDLAVLDFLLVGGNMDPSSTFFSGIQALPPAHTMVWSGGEPSVRRYWTRPIDEPLHYRKPETYVDQFVSLLDSAIRDRLRTPRVSLPMSGGLDSTLLAARVLKVAGGACDLHAYSVYFENLLPDAERVYAEAAARHLGIPIHFLCADNYRPFQGHAEISRTLPEPNGEATRLIQVDLHRQMAARSRVAFFGEGPDDMLVYEWAPYLRHLRRRKRYLRIGIDLARSFIADRRIPLAYWWRRKPLGDFYERPGLPDWIQPDMVHRYALRERWESYLAIPADAHPWRPAAYASLSGAAWNAIFVNADPGVCGLHREVRHPYLDLRLARFLLSIPVIPWCRKKLIFRRASRQVLPEVIWGREKTPLQGNYTAVQVERGAVEGFRVPPLEDFSRYVTRWPSLDPSGNWDMYLSAIPSGLAYWWDEEKKRTSRA